MEQHTHEDQKEKTMAKKKVMSATKFLAAIEAIGCDTYDEAARVLGVGRRSLVRYGKGHLPVPPVVERLLAMYQKHGVPKGIA
jgi:hypothetical protein